MFSKLFGSKRKNEDGTHISHDWSFLKTDMHAHLIPGIDDGAQTLEESIELVKRFQALGYQSLVITPHIKSDYYPNNPAIIRQGLGDLQAALTQRQIIFPLKAAAEYYVDEVFMEMMEAGSLLTIHDNEVLIEFSFMFEPVRVMDILFKIQTKGYKPVIAHPERYAYYHQKLSVFKEMKDRGCLLQLNVLSLAGYYGKSVKEMAEKLLAEKLYDYCGSDAHHLRHTDALGKFAQTKAFERLQPYPFRNSAINV